VGSANCFLTSVQVNCSSKTLLGYTAGATHSDLKDDPLSSLVAIHACVLCNRSEQGQMRFSVLHYAMRFRPGLVLVFHGIKLHKMTLLVLSLDPTEPLLLGYKKVTHIECIPYPKQDILNGMRRKTLPEHARLQGQVPWTPANLSKDMRVSFGSHCQQSRWMKHKMLHNMCRSDISLLPRSRVDFAALSAAVHVPRRA
jgi:hypothetical protein